MTTFSATQNKTMSHFVPRKAMGYAFLYSVLFLILLFANQNLASALSSNDDDRLGRNTPSIAEITNPSSSSLLALFNSQEADTSQIFNTCLSADGDKEMSKDGSRVAMFRLYNQWTGEHFYTSSISERDTIAKAGWKQEGVGWYAPTSENFKPVYRLYNPYVDGGDHHYTTSADEKDACVKAGWSYEGEGWRTVDEGATDYVKVLRQYNPYATTGTHNYTSDLNEQSNLVKDGWKAEGLGWGGYSTLEPSTKAIDFSKAVVDQAAKTYNGKQIKPTATVTDLKAGTDYVVSYGANKNAGDKAGTITITGKGNYTGSKTYYFKINPADISNATVTLGNSLTYNAREQVQTVSKVAADALTLSSSDYSLSDNKHTDAGAYTLKVTGKGNFTGSATKEFSIAKLDISEAEVELGGELTYDGSEQVQNVSKVVASDIVLSTSDYLLVNNEETDAGTYTLMVIGQGNFSGVRSCNFTINAAQINFDKANVDVSDKTYCAKQIEPAVTIEELVESTDYVVTYDSNKDAGQGSVTITGKGNYQGTKTYTFTIYQKIIEEVDWDAISFAYNGENQQPTATAIGVFDGDVVNVTVNVLEAQHKESGEYTAVATSVDNSNYALAENIQTKFTIGEGIDFDKVQVNLSDSIYSGLPQTRVVTIEGLTENVDFVVTYENNVNAGTATLIVSGINAYGGTKEYNFDINPRDIEVSDVTLGPSLVFNGKEQTQTVLSVVNGGETLSESEYSVANNVKTQAGTYKLIIYGYGNFTGTTVKEFTISPLDIAGAKIDLENLLTYNGEPQVQNVSHVIVGDILLGDYDYYVSGNRQTNAGDYELTVTGRGSFTGTATRQFTISPVKIDFGKAKVDTTQRTYEAEKITPEVLVDGLVEDTDFVVTYGANTNVGTGSIEITGKGNYYGSQTFTFIIAPKLIEEVTWGATTFYYNGENQQPNATAVGALGDDVVNVNVSVVEAEHTYRGEYTAKAVSLDNSNYSLSEIFETKFKIREPIDFTKATVDLSSVTYSGLEIEKTVTIDDLVEDVDFKVFYSDNINAGTAKITVTGTGTCYGEEEYTFQIEQLDISNAEVKLGTPLVYSTNPQSQRVESVKVGGVTVPASDYVVSNNTQTNAGTYSGDKALKIDPSATNNITGQVTKEFTIEKATPDHDSPRNLEGYYGSKLSTVTFETYSNGKFTWDEPDTILNTLGREFYFATFTPNDTDNYNTVGIMLAVNITANGIVATFDVNAPQGTTAKIDGKSVSSVKKILDYDSSTSKQHTLAAKDFPTVLNVSDTSYVFAGWSKNKSDVARVGIAPDQLVGEVLDADVTYYAIWLDSKGYWLGTKDATIDYDDEAYFATHDENYVCAADIKADMEVLHDEDSLSYKTVKATWDQYYDEDNVRLYATYEGGENESTTDGTSELNKYVEFRILEVSGAGGHKNTNDYLGEMYDESAVTFMATHFLPTAYAMKNRSSSNDGGWENSDLKDSMNSGEIYEHFSDGFKEDVLSVTKVYGTGNGSEDTATEKYKFWIISIGELGGTWCYDVDEGGQYAWCNKSGINRLDEFAVLANWTTRNKSIPVNSERWKNYNWWTRTPKKYSSEEYLAISYQGNLNNEDKAEYYNVVTPCFAF